MFALACIGSKFWQGSITTLMQRTFCALCFPWDHSPDFLAAQSSKDRGELPEKVRSSGFWSWVWFQSQYDGMDFLFAHPQAPTACAMSDTLPVIYTCTWICTYRIIITMSDDVLNMYKLFYIILLYANIYMCYSNIQYHVMYCNGM